MLFLLYLFSLLIKRNTDKHVVHSLASNIENEFTIVLDLDDTLIYAESISKLHYYSHILHKSKGNALQIDDEYYIVHIRPFALEFIQNLHALNYELILFTASLQPYADAVMKLIDPNQLVKRRYYRSDCTPVYLNGKLSWHQKDLTKLNQNIDNILLIDDNDYSFLETQQNNKCLIPKYSEYYLNNKADHTLLKMYEEFRFLTSLHQ
eukprot:NODE_152_length_15391_cov_0.883272.p10 type:complete len:207 gc:universal NODE_152_length_15391_cov_0.883272:1641-2261(+)